MALGRGRRLRREVDYWPGFVDALSTLLLAIMFLLSVFVIAQFLLSRDLSGRDTVLDRLNSQIAELNQLLALERSNSTDFQDQISALQASLAGAETERTRLQAALDGTRSGPGAGDAGSQIGTLQAQVDSERQVSAQARTQIDLLNQQLSALRQQIAALEDALGASESRDRESQTQIADLGRRLNVALAQRVQELARYRSDFFGRLREILADRDNIRIVGDRFVFQSEVLFSSGADVLQPAGRDEMEKLAEAIIQLNREIPSDINWIIRVDGHTDNVPITGGRFADNWQLSTARAAAVVRFLVGAGVPANRLAATGFGEFQPLVAGDTPEARARNRRIELKLTER
ncbi:peptidoglycan -binding protein [Aureimonas phyllosphaerae]|uniref:Chemotaxis protein MotB n=1 Tax=Aureimonas phyllosphaerae TaxID=1166078 RepID=A0A7W6BW86_9HYPH|nr:peptidoglycan -binding protein [Aureimonas phyllosphaerae]MBB3933942.1 chemotaxis protein MotB [Aureimonas phyllosphaerae]MBB3958842.1 chemotaxis protein MotB [Aureimonas phyllosphaerae]SFF20096.1 chemotaxis protein MotB [Aureimonas phyllosphaerae]